MPLSFSAKLACDLIRFASKHGASESLLYERLGLEKRYRDRDDIRIPAKQMSNLWALAHELTDDSFLAFHMGVEFTYTARTTPSMIMQSCSNVLEAFELAISYSEIIANVLSLELRQDDENFYIEYMPKEGWSGEQSSVVNDSLAVAIVSNLNSLQMCLGKFVSPSILSFQFAQPNNVKEFLTVFNSGIEFDKPYNRIGFPKDVSDLPIATYDNGLLGTLTRYCDELKQRYSPEHTIIGKVREIVVAAFKAQSVPTLEKTATQLNMSERTLQRKLTSAHSSFQEELDHVRKDLARSYLAVDMPLLEIGFLLGYADTTSFVRAYKRWHGVTPGRLT